MQELQDLGRKIRDKGWILNPLSCFFGYSGLKIPPPASPEGEADGGQANPLYQRGKSVRFH